MEVTVEQLMDNYRSAIWYGIENWRLAVEEYGKLGNYGKEIVYDLLMREHGMEPGEFFQKGSDSNAFQWKDELEDVFKSLTDFVDEYHDKDPLKARMVADLHYFTGETLYTVQRGLDNAKLVQSLGGEFDMEVFEEELIVEIRQQ